MLCSLYCNYKYSFVLFFFLRGKRSLLSPHCFALSVCRENKGFVSRPWTRPDGSTHMFPSKVGFLPLASCSETHACAGENLFHLISGVSISDTRYFSQGLCLCDSTFWVAGEQWPVVAAWGCCSCDLGRAAGLGVVFRAVVTDERWLRAARSPALPRNKGMRLPADRVKGLSQGWWGRSWLPSHLPDNPDESRSSQTCRLLFSQRFWTPIVSPCNWR